MTAATQTIRLALKSSGDVSASTSNISRDRTISNIAGNVNSLTTLDSDGDDSDEEVAALLEEKDNATDGSDVAT